MATQFTPSSHDYTPHHGDYKPHHVMGRSIEVVLVLHTTYTPFDLNFKHYDVYLDHQFGYTVKH